MVTHDPILKLEEQAKAKLERGRSMIAEGETLAETARLKIADGQRMIREATIEAEAYERARNALLGTGSWTAAKDRVGEQDPDNAFDKVSEKWRKIYSELYTNVDPPYSYDDVILVMEFLGHGSPKKNSIRSHMLQSVKSGLFDKPAEGKFAFSELAIQALELKKEKGPAVAGPKKNEGAVDGSQGPASHLRSEGSIPSASTPLQSISPDANPTKSFSFLTSRTEGR